ncbi:MAG: alpha/beta hydrolase [bacterium]|nr:alpha/beta hydrolase [bacterium]
MAGHGATQPVMDPTIVSEAKRLEEFIRTSGMSYPTLVGHGLGGMVALQYALDHPGDTHRLILLDTAPRQLADKEQKQQIGQKLIEDYDRFVGERYAMMSPDDEVTEQILDMALRTHRAHVRLAADVELRFRPDRPAAHADGPAAGGGQRDDVPAPGGIAEYPGGHRLRQGTLTELQALRAHRALHHAGATGHAGQRADGIRVTAGYEFEP